MDSDEAPLGNETNSKTNLIDVQHVGVTAKLRTPLKKAIPECSSTETEGMGELFKSTSRKKYNKLIGEDSESTVLTTPPLSATISTTESSKLLYEMHAERQQTYSGEFNNRRARMRKQNALSRIEFQLYNKSAKRLKGCRCQRVKTARKRAATSLRQKRVKKGPPFLKRLRASLKEMCTSKAPIVAESYVEAPPQPSLTQPAAAAQSQPRDCGVYTFEHGCADFLRVTDSPPMVLSNVLAERATYLATRFWAEFFGGLHIGVSFLVTFLLQTYRFLLYALINTLLVGLLQMTSDYLVKPMLTVAFNGFLQPPFIFIYNILTSFRDLLEPVADTLNNFMKPVATVGRSLRFVQVSYSKKKFIKDV